MTSTRQLAQTDEEALLPKRVKQNKHKKSGAETSTRAIAQAIQQIDTRLNTFKQERDGTNEQSLILQTEYANKVLAFLDKRNLLAYSTTSKQAYINTFENPSNQVTFFAASTKQQLNRAKAREHQADVAISIVVNEDDLPPEKRKYFLGLTLNSLIRSGASILLVAPVAIGSMIFILAIGNRRPNLESDSTPSTPLPLPTSLTLIFSSLPLMFLMCLAHSTLKRRFRNIQENALRDIAALNQLQDALEKNDRAALKEILGENTDEDHDSLKMEARLSLFQPKATETQSATEQTPLLNLAK
ncbi:MAG TPA: hypothetical protein VFU82_05020 [Gammaproteobacteria bacterium]|nr:hypothetical protein [Gammaproteobacteria bacterium]